MDYEPCIMHHNDRFVVNLHYVYGDDDTVGNKFPVQTFITDCQVKLLAELQKLFSNDLSGVNKIVIFDRSHNFDELSEVNVGQAPRDL